MGNDTIHLSPWSDISEFGKTSCFKLNFDFDHMSERLSSLISSVCREKTDSFQTLYSSVPACSVELWPIRHQYDTEMFLILILTFVAHWQLIAAHQLAVAREPANRSKHIRNSRISSALHQCRKSPLLTEFAAYIMALSDRVV